MGEFSGEHAQSSVLSLCEPCNYKRRLCREGTARTVCGSGMNPLPTVPELVVRLGNVQLTFPIDRLPVALSLLISPDGN